MIRDRSSGRREGLTGVSRRRLLRAGALGATALTVPAITAAGAHPASHRCSLPDDGSGFHRRDPGDVALDPEGVQEALDYATERSARSVRVYRHNCLVGTSRLDPATESTQRNLWSSTKGVVSMLTGRAATLGHLSLSDRIGQYVTEADGAHGRITVEQLLTQSSGLPLNWMVEGGELPPDTVRYTLDLPVEDEPGTDFEYGQTTVTLLAHTVERAVGDDIQSFAQRELFGLVGIERDDWFWRRDRAGNTHGYAYLYLAPKDFARLGHVMLHDGAWRGEQLIDESYVDRASSPSDTNGVYGYLYWVNTLDRGYTVGGSGTEREVENRLVASAPRDMYMFVGLQDQICFVIPSLDMVVTRTGTHTRSWQYEFFRILMQAVRDRDIEDPGPAEGGSGDEYDREYYFDTEETMAALGFGPHAPEDCNAAGCDGEVAYEGTVQGGEDAARTGIGNLEDRIG